MSECLAVVQARTGSSRLPGKVMYPLAGRPALSHVVERLHSASTIDRTVVATSSKRQDDVLARYVPEFGAEVYRGSEENVLKRFYEAADRRDPDVLVRITGDCPLLDPRVVDAVVSKLRSTSADYATNVLERSFPRGLDVEAFTAASFETVYERSNRPHHEEHVTPYYRENPSRYDLVNLSADEVYDEPDLRDRTEVRLTLDEAADYELLDSIYEELYDGEPIGIENVIEYLDATELATLNAEVEQKEVSDEGNDSS